jgi:hypothetical protein
MGDHRSAVTLDVFENLERELGISIMYQKYSAMGSPGFRLGCVSAVSRGSSRAVVMHARGPDIQESPMLPDYIIYDELKRDQEREGGERPRIEAPQPSRPEFDKSEEQEEDESEEESDRGVTIIEI